MGKYVTHDSGHREVFGTGMVRDRREGKGRYDLISPHALRRIALILERGAVKYLDRNWEQGAPYSRFLDSALRHTEQYLEGLSDEDHLAAACFNLMAIMHFEELGRTDLDDRPKWEKNNFGPEFFGNLTTRPGTLNCGDTAPSSYEPPRIWPTDQELLRKMMDNGRTP